MFYEIGIIYYYYFYYYHRFLYSPRIEPKNMSEKSFKREWEMKMLGAVKFSYLRIHPHRDLTLRSLIAEIQPAAFS